MMIVGCEAAIITITVGPRPARRRGLLSAVHMGHCSQGAGAKRSAHDRQRVVGAREWEAYTARLRVPLRDPLRGLLSVGPVTGP